MDSFVLDIKPSDLETWGDHSLEGTLIEKGWRNDIDQPITLRFWIHDLKWCEEHKGPDIVATPEYAFLCLSCSIANLIRQGRDVTILKHEVREM